VEAAQMTKAPIQKFADCVRSYNNFLAWNRLLMSWLL
jgi:hypothetical protein